MIGNLRGWQLVFYILTYPIIGFLAYYAFVAYYSKNKGKYRLFMSLFWTLLVAFLTVLISASLPMTEGLILIYIWGTSGLIAVIVFLIKKGIKKRDDGNNQDE
ncbi:hypothetical protein KAW48_09830 [candidate division WOR-3 bacterium]|nr:hypothetical protein [candidate division WOR-3 bacterium]